MDSRLNDPVDDMMARAISLGLYRAETGAAIGDVEGYEALQLIFEMAYQQAALGKGKARHASDRPFHDQPMQRESDDLGTPAGLLFQARKKCREGASLPTEQAQVAEMLGAINYLAGWVVWTLRHADDARYVLPEAALDA